MECVICISIFLNSGGKNKVQPAITCFNGYYICKLHTTSVLNGISSDAIYRRIRG